MKGNLQKETFEGHANIKMEDNELGIEFSRAPGDSSFNYFTVICNDPLTTDCTYKIHVKAVYESDRFVDVGIMPLTKVTQTKSDAYINRWNSGGISYCGYAHGGNLTGNYPTKEASSSSGLKPGDHFYFEFKPKQSIRYWNDEGTIELK